MISTEVAKTDQHPRLKIFLCHTAADKAVVRHLYRRLKADGFKPWLDEADLLPGQNWREEIPKAVRDADVVLVCLSHNSITKEGFVQKEVKFALDVSEEKPPGTIFIIPVRLEAVDVPDRFGQWQWADLYRQDGYERLVLALRIRADAIGLTVPVVRSHPQTPYQEITLQRIEAPNLPKHAKFLYLTGLIKTSVSGLKKPIRASLGDLTKAICVGMCWAAALYALYSGYRFFHFASLELAFASLGAICGIVLALFVRPLQSQILWNKIALITLAWCLCICVSKTLWPDLRNSFLGSFEGSGSARESLIIILNSIPLMTAGAVTGMTLVDTRTRRSLYSWMGAISFGLSTATALSFIDIQSIIYNDALQFFTMGTIGIGLLFLFIRLLTAYDVATIRGEKRHPYIIVVTILIISLLIAIAYPIFYSPEAIYFKGYDYYIGKRGAKDYVLAKNYFEQAAGRGYGLAMINLGMLYENGQGVTQDFEQARDWYEKATAAGDARFKVAAMYRLGVLYVKGGPGLNQDYDRAWTWLRQSADGGNTGAMNEIAAFFLYGRGAPTDYVQARQWLLKAAERKNTWAANQLGSLYEHGLGGSQDYPQAIHWYQTAADDGDPSAMTSLGNLYQEGSGVAKDYRRARQLYEKASALGDEEAKKRLLKLPQ